MKTPLDPRHLKRQKIVQELFSWAAQTKIKNQKSKIKNLDDKTSKILSAILPVDEIIKSSAPEWGIEKINQIDLAILRQAVYELCIELTEPPKVIIDEAIELAKEFGAENSSPFVNGALGKALLNKSRILKIIANKLGVEEDRLAPDANLLSDLNITDLEVADLITVIEKDLAIGPPPDLTQIKTVADIFEYIEDHND